jgi:ribosomal protein L30E
MAYIGLEIAMSFVKLNQVRDYWTDKMFFQQKDFQSVMPRKLFQDIRGSVMLHDPDLYDHNIAGADPLHHSRNLLSHFLRNLAKVAVPVGTSALDENSARTKARCAVVTFNAEKPDKFAIRYYCVVSTVHTYVHSMMDNRSGNKTQQTAPEAYCRLFSELQMAHQTKIYEDPNHKRVIFCDNFYTRHNLATLLKQITDGEIRLVGTCRFNNVDATNCFYLKQAIESLKDKPRGSWVLVRAYDKVDNYDLLKRQHTN